MDSTSESLLLRLRAGNDQNAWTTFVELYTPLIFYWSRKSGLQTNDAADLVQDVLTLAFQKMPSFQYDASKSFRGWLRTVTLNRFREKIRKKSVGAIPATQSVLVSVSDPENAESTWDLDYHRMLVQQANQLLEREFQPATWKAIQMYVFQNQPATKAAEENGLSVWTVYAAKSRFMSRLREILDGLL